MFYFRYFSQISLCILAFTFAGCELFDQEGSIKVNILSTRGKVEGVITVDSDNKSVKNSHVSGDSTTGYFEVNTDYDAANTIVVNITKKYSGSYLTIDIINNNKIVAQKESISCSGPYNIRVSWESGSTSTDGTNTGTDSGTGTTTSLLEPMLAGLETRTDSDTDFCSNSNTTSPPQNFSAEQGATGTINLTWDAPDGDYDQYQLTVSGTDAPTDAITIAKAEVSYSVSGLTSGESYTFSLVAINGSIESSVVTDTATAL